MARTARSCANEWSHIRSDMDRRTMLARMAMLLGAAALPGEALAKPAHRAPALPRCRRSCAAQRGCRHDDPRRPTRPERLRRKSRPSSMRCCSTGPRPQRRIELVGALGGSMRLPWRKRRRLRRTYPRQAYGAAHRARCTLRSKTCRARAELTGMAAMMAGPAVADPGYAKLRELIITLFFYSRRGADQRADLRARARRLDALDQAHPRDPQYRRAGHVLERS